MADTVADTDTGTWIFGYGSLIFRADFPYLHRTPATLTGWSRRFWQASSDHRGTPDYPGRVVTLVPSPQEVCWGLAYQIADEYKTQVLEHLDYREKGGYERLAATLNSQDNQSIEAITYLADAQNPEYLGEAPVDVIARQIMTAEGPSGKNSEYLFSLEASLNEHGQVDSHVFTLAETVRHLSMSQRN